MSQIQPIAKKVRNVVIVIAYLFLTGYFLFKLNDAEKRADDLTQLNSVLNDTLVVKKNSMGLLVAKIGVLESYKVKTFTQLKTQDSVVKKLQLLVVEYQNKIKGQGSVTIIGTLANVNTTVPTIIDSATTVVNTIEYPIYNSSFNLKGWVWGDVKASKDSTQINFKFKEEIDAVVGRDKTGFLGLGKGKPFVEVTLHNPYNTVKYLRTYTPKIPPVKKFSIGPSAAYGVDQNLNKSFFIGVGVNYSIIRF